MRHNSMTSAPFDIEIDALPNYTLVSGLPTYDDALEQLRLSNSTNHLLINHQTFMKLFGSTQPVSGTVKDKDSQDDNQSSYASNQSLPRYDDVVAVISSPADNSSASIMSILNAPKDRTAKSSTVETTTTDSIAVSRPTAHRFTCTAVPPLPIELNSKRTTLLRHDRRRASEIPLPQFMRLASTPAFNRPLNMGDNSSSLGSLNIIKEIRRNNQSLHESASSGNFDHIGGGRANFGHRGSIY